MAFKIFSKHISTERHAWIFTKALFIIAPNEKNSNAPSSGDWINCGISINQHCWTTLIQLMHTPQMNLKSTILSGRCHILFIWNFQKGKTISDRRQISGCLAPGLMDWPHRGTWTSSEVMEMFSNVIMMALHNCIYLSKLSEFTLNI